jgi:hypothetical protein
VLDAEFGHYSGCSGKPEHSVTTRVETCDERLPAEGWSPSQFTCIQPISQRPRLCGGSFAEYLEGMGDRAIAAGLNPGRRYMPVGAAA